MVNLKMEDFPVPSDAIGNISSSSQKPVSLKMEDFPAPQDAITNNNSYSAVSSNNSQWKQNLVNTLGDTASAPISALMGAYQNFSNLGTGAENLGKRVLNSTFGTNLQQQEPT